MALISFREYAKRHGISLYTVKNRAAAGLLETAVLIGGVQWAIDEDEPWVDHIKRGRGARENADYVSRVRKEARNDASVGEVDAGKGQA